MQNIGSLFLQLGLDTSNYNDMLDRAKQDAVNVGREIEKNLNIKVTLDKQALQSINQLNSASPIKVRVDDSELTALNKHLDRKKQHLQEVTSYFKSNPIKVFTDTKELDAFEKRLDELEKRKAKVSVSSSTGEKSTTRTRLDADTSNFEKQVQEAIEKGFKNASKSSDLGAIFKAVNPMTYIGSIVGGVSRGITERLGQELSGGLSKGLVRAFENATGGVIGSTELLGEKLAGKLLGSLSEELSSGLPDVFKDTVTSLLNDALGEADIIIASRSARQRQEKQKRQDLGLAREAATTERREALRENKTLVAKRADVETQLTSSQEKVSQIEKLQASVNEASIFRTVFDKSAVEDLEEQYRKVLLDQIQKTRENKKVQIQSNTGTALSNIDNQIGVTQNQIRGLSDREQEALEKARQQQQLAVEEAKTAVSKARMSQDPTKIAEAKSNLELQQKTLDSMPIRAEDTDAIKALKEREEKLKARREKIVKKSEQELLRVEKEAVERFKSLSKIDLGADELSDEDIQKLSIVSQALAKEVEILFEDQKKLEEELQEVDKQINTTRKKLTSTKKVTETVAPEQLPKTYEDALRQAYGGEVPEHLKPKLMVNDAGLAKSGAIAKYGIESNTVEVQKSLMDAIEAGELTESQFNDLLEELNHAADFAFGQFKGVQARMQNRITRGTVQSTPEEIRQLAPELMLYEPEQREYERNAKTRALRDSRQLFAQQDLSQLESKAGYGGRNLAEAFNEVNLSSTQALAQLEAAAKKQGVSLSEEIALVVQVKKEVAEGVKEALNAFAKLKAEGGTPEEVAELAKLFEEKLNSLDRIDQALAFVEKSTKSKIRKELEKQRSQMVVAEPVAVEAEVVKPGIRERLASVAQMGGDVLRSKPVQQAANFAGNVARGVGGAAKVAYAGAQMVEDVALDAIPFGRGLKAVGQQVVIPAALVGGMSMVPGVGGAVGGLLHLAGGAGAAGGHMAAGGLLGQATGALSALPQAFGLQATATGLATSAIEGAATGAGALAAQGGAVVLGGRIMQVLARRAGKKAVNAMLPASNQPLALPMATPQREMETLEVEAKPMQELKQLSASTGQMVVRDQSGLANAEKSDKEKAIEFANKAGQTVRNVVDASQRVSQAAQRTAGDIAHAANQAKDIAQKFWGAYKLLGEAVKSGDLQKAEQLLDYVKQNAERAKEEIQQTYTELKQSGASRQELSRTAGAKGNVSRSVSQAEKQVAKLRKMKASEVPQDAIEVNAAKYDAWEDELSAQRLQMPKVNAEDLAVNTAGFLGSLVGGQHGMVGGLAGDLIGALLARQGINLGKAGVGAYRDLSGNKEFSEADKLKQAQQLMAEIAKRMQSQNVQQSLGNDLTGDLAGWAIGNGSAMLGNAMGLGGIPMKGAAVAMATVPQLQKLRENVASRLSGNSGEEELSAQKMLEFDPLKKSRGMSDEQKKELKDLMALLDQAIGHADTWDSAFKQANKEVDESFKQSGEAIQSNLERLAKGDTPITETEKKLGFLGNAAKYVGTAFVGWQVISGVIPMLLNLAKGATDAAMEFEKFQNVINFTSGGAGQGAKNLEFITQQSKDLRTDLKQSLNAYAQFAGSTQGTALEGEQTNKVFSAVSKASSVRQLDPQRQELVMTALSQMASKGVISMEELRQQLGESLPGAMNVAARSMGMTTQEFNKLVATGQLLSEDFLPKFAQQLSAESSTGLGAAAESSQASINRLNNSMYELQVGIGKGLLPLQKVGFNAVASGLELINKNVAGLSYLLGFLATGTLVALIKGLMAIPGVATLAATAFGFMKTVVIDLMATLAKFAVSFVVYTAAIETVKYLGRAFYDTSGAIGDFAKSSTSNLEAYRKALSEARGETEKFNKTKPQGFDIKDIATNAIGAVGNIASTAINMVPGAGLVKGAIGTKSLGLPNPGDVVDAVMNKERNDKEVAMGNIFAANEQRVSAVTSMLGRSGQGVAELGQLKDLDRKIEGVQARRRGLAIANPNDKDQMRALQAEEQGLLAQREKASKPVALLQEGLASDIEGLKSLKKQLQEAATQATSPEEQEKYAKQIADVERALDSTQKAQDKFNTAMKGSLTTLNAFAKAFQTIIDKLEDANRGAESFYNKSRTEIAKGELSGELTSGQADVQRALANEGKITANQNNVGNAIKQAQGELEGQNYKEVLKSMGISQNAGQSELKTILDKVQSPKEKAILENLIKLKDLQGTYEDLTAQAAEAQVSTRNSRQNEFLQRLDKETKDAEASFKQMQNKKQEGLIKDQTSIIRKASKNEYFSETDQQLAEAGLGQKKAQIQVAAVDEQTKSTQNQLDQIKQAYDQGIMSAEEYHNRVRDLSTQLSDLRVEKSKALQSVEEANARKIEATNKKILETFELSVKKKEAAITIDTNNMRMGVNQGLLKAGLTDENQAKASLANNQIEEYQTGQNKKLIEYQLQQNKELRDKRVINEKTYIERTLELRKQLSSESLKLTELQIQKEKAAQELFNKQIDARLAKTRAATADIVRGLELEKGGYDNQLKALDLVSQKTSALMGLEQARAQLAQAYADQAQQQIQQEVTTYGKALDIAKRAKDEKDPRKQSALKEVLNRMNVGSSNPEDILLKKQEKERDGDTNKLRALETQRSLMEKQFALAQKQLEIDLKRSEIQAKMAAVEAQITFTKQQQTVRDAEGELKKAVRSKDPTKILEAQTNLKDQQQLLGVMGTQVQLANDAVNAQGELSKIARDKLATEQQTQRVQSDTSIMGVRNEMQNRGVDQALEQIDQLGYIKQNPFDESGMGSYTPQLGYTGQSVQSNLQMSPTGQQDTFSGMLLALNAIQQSIDVANQILQQIEGNTANFAQGGISPGNQSNFEPDIAVAKQALENAYQAPSAEKPKNDAHHLTLQSGYTMPPPAQLPQMDLSGLEGFFKTVGYRAAGGVVASGQPYVVGEKGMELFVPTQSGRIIPNNFLNPGVPTQQPSPPSTYRPESVAMVQPQASSGGGFNELISVLKTFAAEVKNAATSPRTVQINGSEKPTQDAADFWQKMKRQEIQEGGY